MSQPFLSWIEVDLDAVAFNVQGLKRHIGPNVVLGAVVKGGAYGHGAVQVAKTLLENGTDWIIVNRSNEGIELRQAGIEAPLLVLGYTLPQEAERMVRWDLKPTVSNMLQVEAYSAAGGKYGKVVDVHVKVDTGLGRQGVLPEEALDFVRGIARTPHINIEGVYSHLSVADEGAPDSVAYTRQQFEKLLDVRSVLTRAGYEIPLYHICNTAGTLNFPEMHLDMVRCGSAIGGIYPSPDVKRSVARRPALSLKSHVARVKVLLPGSAISYGRTYVTSVSTKVALIPVGYGDGYRRALSNKGSVLIRGQRAPIVGRVCMDQCMADVSHIPDVALHDEVVLLGCQGEACITGDEIGELLGTSPYDITTGFTPRLPRVYMQGGAVVGVQDLIRE